MEYFDGIETEEAAKERYRELAKQYHPDAGGPDADSDAMAAINDQYKEILIAIKNKPVKRRKRKPAISQQYRDEIINSAGDLVSSGVRAIAEGILDRYFKVK